MTLCVLKFVFCLCLSILFLKLNEFGLKLRRIIMKKKLIKLKKSIQGYLNLFIAIATTSKNNNSEEISMFFRFVFIVSYSLFSLRLCLSLRLYPHTVSLAEIVTFY